MAAVNGYQGNTPAETTPAATGSKQPAPPAKTVDSQSVLKRLQSELMGLMMGGDPGISAFPEEDNIFCWKGTITGSNDTVFEGIEYRLSLAFSNDYPFKPPKVKFETCCFHPNVDLYGNICLDILQDKWSSAYDVRTTLLSIQSLLGEPNISSPLNNQAAQLWSNQEGKFAIIVIRLHNLRSLIYSFPLDKPPGMSISAQNPDISGERQSGQDVRTQNVMACQAVSNIVKTSLGPVGLDKMLVDDIGDVTITNDGATILRMLEVEHPAAKVLVELAELQDREVGDGTTSVVIVAAELLKRANDLVRNKIHPTSIISGYRLAMREACKYIEEKLVTKVEKLGKVPLINCAKTSMSSKLISGDSDFFANLVVDAVLSVKMTNQRGEIKYPIKGINILKAHGQSARDSYLLNGYALNTGRAAQGMPLRVSPAKIACLDFNLQKTKMQLGVQVVVNDPRELEKIRQREADMTKERIEKLLKAGANVILTTKGIDDMALKYFVEAGAIAVRRVRKEDMRHVAKATGATLVTTFADMEGEETFDPAHLGSAEEVVEERIADDDVVLIKGTKTSSAVSLILRGANDYMLDEMERALHDALCIVKRTLESNTVVAGGGAVESALSVYLEHLATTLGSREQLAIAEFADALLIIPKVLAVNAAKDATELVAKLRAYHHTAQTKADKKHYSSMGLDLVNGTIRNNLEAGVIEPAMSKVKIIQFATEAAITILRIDDMIKLVKEDGQGDE
ncbi:unnamed protein product [Brassica napus]|uniref:T-complex protein 1 subunit alpha n=3 Tax=Brassica TaxID=3705 RepID=A0A816RUI4_BRANA|nr:unnamed protein product [Brassica napus]